MTMFRACFAIDALAFLGVFLFFLAGLGDGRVSGFNIGIWLALVGIPAMTLLGALRLKAIGRPRAATGLLALLAAPILLGGAFTLLVAFLFATNPGGHH